MNARELALIVKALRFLRVKEFLAGRRVDSTQNQNEREICEIEALIERLETSFAKSSTGDGHD